MVTPNYGYELPTVGGDDDTWGTKLNDNWTDLDTDLKATDDAVAALDARLTAAEAAVENLKIKVGGLYLSTTDTDPATTLGYGTWAAHAAGRAIVGVGDNGETDWLVNDTAGAEEHTLSIAEMPTHDHVVNDPGHSHALSQQVWSRTGDSNKGFVNQGLQCDFTTTVTAQLIGSNVSINTEGGGAAHNNVQPSIAVYIWRRTA